jgi:hypothetical protein
MTTFNGKMLGRGIPGATNNSKLCGAGNAIQNLQVLERSRLRRAFGNSRIALTYPVGPHGASALWASSTGRAKTTPFRVAFNGGDPNGTTNTYTSTKYGKESNQVTRGSLGRLSSLKLGDSVRQSNSKEGAAWSGNVKFVYDSSDYTRYKNLRAHNRNYNDKNRAGGEQPNSTVFSVLNRVR